MARDFTVANTQYLENANAVLTSPPISMSCLFNTPGGITQNPISISDISGTHRYQLLFMNGDVIRAQATSGVFRRSETTATLTANTWEQAGAVFASTTSRTAYLEGVAATENTQASNPTGLDTTSLGRVGIAIPTNYYDGLLAEVGIWNVALTDAEMATLAKGFSPLFIRPGNLVAYWPLIGRNSPETDSVGGFNLTLSGGTGVPVVAVHPRVIMPSSQIIMPPPGAPPAVGNPWYYYAQQG